MKRLLLTLLLAGAVVGSFAWLGHRERALIGTAAAEEVFRRFDLPREPVIIDDLDMLGPTWTAGVRIGARRFLVTGRSARSLGPVTLAFTSSDLIVEEVLAID